MLLFVVIPELAGLTSDESCEQSLRWNAWYDCINWADSGRMPSSRNSDSRERFAVPVVQFPGMFHHGTCHPVDTDATVYLILCVPAGMHHTQLSDPAPGEASMYHVSPIPMRVSVVSNPSKTSTSVAVFRPLSLLVRARRNLSKLSAYRRFRGWPAVPASSLDNSFVRSLSLLATMKTGATAAHEFLTE